MGKAKEDQNGYEEALRWIKKAAADCSLELDLSGLQLTTLPPEIGSLTALQKLDLNSNQLTTLPPQIGSLTALQTLDLSSNQLATLPPEIGSLTVLQTLILTGNKLVVLPPEVGLLTSMEKLWSGLNQLSTMPPEICKLTALKELSVSHAILTKLPPEIGSLTALQTLDFGGNQLTTLPPEIGSLTALQTLRLGKNQLTTLPPEIGSLTTLHTLDLNSNQLATLPPEIGSLTALQKLVLSENQLTTLPPEIGSLNALQTLRLDSNRLTTLPAEIGSLTALQWLDLISNQLTTLPPEIGSLTALQTLYLRGNQLASLPPEIGSLTALQELYLNGNQFTTLPPTISSIVGLRALGLGTNRFETLPPQIGSFPELRKLFLGTNLLKTVPAEIGRLTKLNELYLDRNKLTELPPELGLLSNLQRLDLHVNQLATLPPQIGSLSTLQTLNLADNQLSSLPGSLEKLDKLRRVFLHDNTDLGLPTEVLGVSWQECKPYRHDGADPAKPAEILRFYFRRQKERADAEARGVLPDICTLNEVKILIVGEPGVGKTDLAHWLIHGKPHPNPKSTIGIKIATWPIPNPNGNPIRANVWDFGGQEIMQATHQFFLTERSLYLLVLDSRENEEQGKVRYWLDKIRAFGGDSPVIIVLNKVDEGQEQPDEPRLKKDYPKNLLDLFFRTACRAGIWAKAGDGIGELRAAIINRVRKLENVHVGVPRSYLTAKDRIEKAAAEHKKLDLTQFGKACDESGVPCDALDRSTLLGFLQSLGTVYHYERPGRPGSAARTFVLDPQWLSDGVFTILTDNLLLQSGGRLDPKTLGELFARSASERKNQYCEEDYDFLLEMMEGDPFELCFRIPNTNDLRLIPERLAPFEPNHGIKRENSRNVEYHYKYLPGGLIPRFIVRMHESLKDGDAWRNGVVLTISGQRVLIRGVKEEKRVYVSAEGHTAASRHALGVVRQNLDAVHRAMKHVSAEERVPLPDDLDVTVTYKSLCELESNPKKGPSYQWTPDKAKRDYSVRELLDEIEAPEARELNRDWIMQEQILIYGSRNTQKPADNPEPMKKPNFVTLSFVALVEIILLGLGLALMHKIVASEVGFVAVAITTVLLGVLIFIFIALISDAITGTAFERLVVKTLDRVSLLRNLIPENKRPKD